MAKRLFQSSVKFCNISTPKGKVLTFKFGRYVTEDEEEIAFLDAEIKAGHPTIFVDPNHLVLSKQEEDPLGYFKEQVIKEYLAEQARFNDPKADMGTSVQGPLKAASTSDIAPVTVGGPGVLATKLQQLRTQAAVQVPQN